MPIVERLSKVNSDDVVKGIERAFLQIQHEAEYFHQITRGLNIVLNPYGITIGSNEERSAYHDPARVVVSSIDDPALSRKQHNFNDWSEAIRFAMSVYADRVVERIQKD